MLSSPKFSGGPQARPREWQNAMDTSGLRYNGKPLKQSPQPKSRLICTKLCTKRGMR